MRVFRLVLLVVAIVAGLSIVSWAVEPVRTTVRVDVWSLWWDREVKVAPLGPGSTVKLCAACKAERLEESTARGGRTGIEWSFAGRSARTAAEIDFVGGVRLTAHGETLRLAWPMRLKNVQGALEMVTTVPVERYVEMVVAAESGEADSEESLKALAVVARSFALDRTVRHAGLHAGFDLCDSTHCQWLRWRSTPAAHRVALETAGETLWLGAARMGGYFHQNCGGRTATASEIWPGRAGQQGLESRADPYCVRVGSAEWSAQISHDELTAALAAGGLARPGWKSLRVAGRGASGRVTKIDVDGTKIPVEEFRLAVGRALGWNRVRSDWFEISVSGASFLFHGRGSGHGVGLCQVGAAEMAREGKNYREILAQYFSGARVADAATGRPWKRIAAQGFFLETTESEDAGFVSELNRALETAEGRSGLHPRAPLVVRAFASTPDFRDATLAPGWVAAFTEGNWIALQPLRVLMGRKLLGKIALHEFLHALVEEQTGAGAPLWLREGLVEAWAGEGAAGPRPAMKLEQVSAVLAHAQSEAESEAAHHAAGWYAAQLLKRYGSGLVLEWLRQAGSPQPVMAELLR
jgi:stage II sporulation protein D